jgi:hypothetical protein
MVLIDSSFAGTSPSFPIERIKALVLLQRDYIQSDKLEPVFARLTFPRKESEDFLRAAMEKSQHRISDDPAPVLEGACRRHGRLGDACLLPHPRGFRDAVAVGADGRREVTL